MTPLKDTQSTNNCVQNKLQHGKLDSYKVTTVDQVIKSQITDECKLCLYPLNNDDPLYIYITVGIFYMKHVIYNL